MKPLLRPRVVPAAALAALLLGLGPVAHAADVYFSVGVPAYPVEEPQYVQAPPVYDSPEPVYVPAQPAVVAPAPDYRAQVVVAPPAQYYGADDAWQHRYWEHRRWEHRRWERRHHRDWDGDDD